MPDPELFHEEGPPQEEGYLPDVHSDPGGPEHHEAAHDEGDTSEEPEQPEQSAPKVSPGQFVRYTLGEGPSVGQERIAQVILPPVNVERDESLLDLYVFERPEDRPHESPAQVLQFEPAVPYNREGGPGTWREMEV